MKRSPIDRGREFLKDTVRLEFDFSGTDQSRGVAPPPLSKPCPPDAVRVSLPREGEGPALQTALLDLAAKAAPLDGCGGCELYQDAEQAERFFFLERWQSPEQHKAGGETLGQEAFAPIMAVLAKPPEGLSLLPVAAA